MGEKEDLRKIEQRIDQILKKIRDDYPFQVSRRIVFSRGRLQMFIEYDIVPEIRWTKEIKVDILKDDYLPPFKKKKILFSYPEFQKENVWLNTYILEAVVSDKISRIMDVDKEVRDIYDLWYLLNLNLDVTKIKIEIRNRLGYELNLFTLLREIKLSNFRKTWQLRLAKQIKRLPPYDAVIRELSELIRSKLIDS